MINFHQPDFTKFPAQLENMSKEELENFKLGVLNDFRPIYGEDGFISKEFDVSLKYLYIDLCNYMQACMYELIAKYKYESEYYRYVEVAELILNDLIDKK